MQNFTTRFAAAAIIAWGFGVTAPAQAAEKLTVLLDWFVNPDHAPLIIAKERGYFADAGLDVDLIAPADPNDPPKLVAAGKAETFVAGAKRAAESIDSGAAAEKLRRFVEFTDQFRAE